MMATSEIFSSETVLTVVMTIFLMLAGIALMAAACHGIYLLFSLPLRRQEHARFFLDLLDTGLADGQSPETTIVEIAKSRDVMLGYRFHLLAAHLETGLRLPEALKQVPGLLPPQLAAMLAVGEKVGDIRKVMPACRKALTSGSSKTTSAVNYLFLLIVLANPVAGIWSFLVVKIVPTLQATMSDLTNGQSPLLLFLLAHSTLVIAVQLAMTGIIWLAVLVYLCGPRGIRWLSPVLKPVTDAINYRLPWRRKRLERDFSAMLAVLLDAEAPEEQAVTLAAQSTDNRVFIRRGEQLAQRLREGVALTEAVQAIDDTGEFRWRLTNAAHGRGGFMAALSGWHDALDAKAYQLEQAASQVITTGLVIVNGCIVGLIVVGVFQVLTSITREAALW
jgi:type II secretory pathway component PulF